MQIFEYIPLRSRQSAKAKYLRNGCLLLALGATIASLIPLTQTLLRATIAKSSHKPTSSHIHAYNAQQPVHKAKHTTHKSSYHPTSHSHLATHKDHHSGTSIKSSTSPAKKMPLILPKSRISTTDHSLRVAQKKAAQVSAMMIPVKNIISTTQTTLKTDQDSAKKDSLAELKIASAIPAVKNTVSTDASQVTVAQTLLQKALTKAAADKAQVLKVQAIHKASVQKALSDHKKSDAVLAKLTTLETRIKTLNETDLGAPLAMAQKQLAILNATYQTDSNNSQKDQSALKEAQQSASQSQSKLKLIQKALANDTKGYEAAKKAMEPYLNKRNNVPLTVGKFHAATQKLGKSYSVQAALATKDRLLMGDQLIKLKAAEHQLSKNKKSVSTDSTAYKLANKKRKSEKETIKRTDNKSSIYHLAYLMNSLSFSVRAMKSWNGHVTHDIPEVLAQGGTFEKPVPGHQTSDSDYSVGYVGWWGETADDDTFDILETDRDLLKSHPKSGQLSKSEYKTLVNEAEQISPLNNPSSNIHKQSAELTSINNRYTPEIEETFNPNSSEAYGKKAQRGDLGQLLADEGASDQEVRAASLQFQKMQKPLKAAQTKAKAAQRLVSEQKTIVDGDKLRLTTAQNTLHLNETNAYVLGRSAHSFFQDAAQAQKTLRESEATLKILQQQATKAQAQVSTLQQTKQGLMSSLNTSLSNANALQQKAGALRDSWVETGDRNTLNAYNETAQELNQLNETIFDLSGERRDNFAFLQAPQETSSNIDEELATMEDQERAIDLSQREQSESLLNDPALFPLNPQV